MGSARANFPSIIGSRAEGSSIDIAIDFLELRSTDLATTSAATSKIGILLEMLLPSASFDRHVALMRLWLAELALALSANACSSSLQKPEEADTSPDGAQPPRGAAGFDFGATPADVKKACQGAGKTWSSNSDESGICSGPASDIGFEATVRVDFCHSKSCVIRLEHRPQSNWMAAYNAVKGKLAQRHGTPTVMPTKAIPDHCRKEEQFVRCLGEEGLRLMFRWQWPNRHQVIFTIGKPEQGDGPTALRVEYVAPAME